MQLSIKIGNVCDNNMVIEILSSDEDNDKPKNSTRKSKNKLRPDYWAEIVNYYIQTNLNPKRTSEFYFKEFEDLDDRKIKKLLNRWYKEYKQ